MPMGRAYWVRPGEPYSDTSPWTVARSDSDSASRVGPPGHTTGLSGLPGCARVWGPSKRGLFKCRSETLPGRAESRAALDDHRHGSRSIRVIMIFKLDRSRDRLRSSAPRRVWSSYWLRSRHCPGWQWHRLSGSLAGQQKYWRNRKIDRNQGKMLSAKFGRAGPAGPRFRGVSLVQQCGAIRL